MPRSNRRVCELLRFDRVYGLLWGYTSAHISEFECQAHGKNFITFHRFYCRCFTNYWGTVWQLETWDRYCKNNTWSTPTEEQSSTLIPERHSLFPDETLPSLLVETLWLFCYLCKHRPLQLRYFEVTWSVIQVQGWDLIKEGFDSKEQSEQRRQTGRKRELHEIFNSRERKTAV